MTRAWIRRLAMLLLACMLTTACTRTPPGGEQVVGFGPGLSSDAERQNLATGDEASDPALDDATFEGGTPGTGDPASSDGGTSRVSDGTTGDGGAPGGGVAPDDGGGASLAQGVDGRTVKVVFHHQHEACGDNPQYSSSRVMTEQGKLVIDEYVKWFNEKVLGPKGWKIDPVFVDDGGPECPEKAQAAGLRIAREIKPFAAVGELRQRERGPVLADVVTRAGIIHIGRNWETYAALEERAPYAYAAGGELAIAQHAFENLVRWIGARVKGTQTPDPTTGVAEEREYGLVVFDSSDGRELAGIIDGYLRDIGVDLQGRIYALSGDVGVAAQTATNTVLKMRQDGVNTLILGLPYDISHESSMSLTEAMNSQNYLPDILIGTYGNAFFDQLHNKRVWSQVRGVSSNGIGNLRTAAYIDESGSLKFEERFEEVAENNLGFERLWRDELGYNQTPSDNAHPSAYGTWSQLSALATGILHAGDTLTPETFAAGLASAGRGQANRCTLARFMGRDYRHHISFDWRVGGTGTTGVTPIYWVNEQTRFGTNGYYQSYDNYRYFHPEEPFPAQPTHDTGKQPVDVVKQERIGLRPWTPCEQFPTFPRN